jgi:hypothetical protein
MGVSMMIMGSQLEEINNRTVEPYVQMIHREELRNARLGKAEHWKEFYAFGFSFLAFTVLLREEIDIGILARWSSDF